ncbi:hypothetical protein [Caulobacter vibrioides]|uniref:hypothetical protein n=1 Tax=Caulobacter vibrioides TaxID=155892 RepID=UPI000BB52573|nr:hypothetical protein [Caulobacter vibrioides]ATC23118.1 hypothetical protein CA608_00500 [Caulobacter vibrioides]PLR13209.1 hypothetical protein CVUC_07760 [Caulobacter vibrioides]
MIDPQGLFSTARLLLGSENKGAPNQARLRRAVSTAYYGLFHVALKTASDVLVGVKHRQTPRYETIYRSFDHQKMRKGCEAVDKSTLDAKAQKAMGAQFVSPEIRDFASAFTALQERRHWADYSTSGKITRGEAQDLIDQAELGAAQLKAASTEERKNFLAFLMANAR